MKRLFQWIAFVPILAHLQAHAAELPDCGLERGFLPIKSLTSHISRSQARYFIEVDGPLKNGTENVYERNDAVLNVELRVVRTVVTMTPNVDFQLKNSWVLSPNFRFRAGAPSRLWRQIELPDGRKFYAVVVEHGTVFLNEAKQFCNKTLGDGVWHAGTLSLEPDEASVDLGLADDVMKSGSLRVIYLGTSAGAMKFEEVWVQGSRIGKSITRTFDQFAKTIEIAGFKFEVMEAKGDRVVLKYAIASRNEIGPAQLDQIALQNAK
jgi:hypothetical protein